MTEVLPALVAILGKPVDDAQMHGDLPLGYDGMNSTARSLDFGGLVVVFGDWADYADAGTMHLVGWGASGRRTANGTRLATPDGIRSGSTVADLEAAFGSSLHLPHVDQPGCGGPPWYFAVNPDVLDLIGSLTAPPSDPEARVDGLGAGSQREGWIPCWEP
jgi:hypothetical protein